MTFREKLAEEHPDCIYIDAVGGCKGCPATYGYEEDMPDFCCAGGNAETCKKCWDREIPNTVTIQQGEPHPVHVEYHLSKNDQAQLEYIQKWKKRKQIRKLHLGYAKTYFKAAVEELILYFKGGE